MSILVLFCTPIFFFIPPFFRSKGYETPKLKFHWEHWLCVNGLISLDSASWELHQVLAPKVCANENHSWHELPGIELRSYIQGWRFTSRPWTISKLEVNIFSNERQITKCRSFCTPTAQTTQELQQYLDAFYKKEHTNANTYRSRTFIW